MLLLEATGETLLTKSLAVGASSAERKATCLVNVQAKEEKEVVVPASNVEMKVTSLKTVLHKMERDLEAEHASNAEKKVISQENAQLQVAVVVEDLASIVERKGICPESVMSHGNQEMEEAVEDHATTVEKKGIRAETVKSQENKERVEEVAEPALTAEKKVTKIETVQSLENQEKEEEADPATTVERKAIKVEIVMNLASLAKVEVEELASIVVKKDIKTETVLSLESQEKEEEADPATTVEKKVIKVETVKSQESQEINNNLERDLMEKVTTMKPLEVASVRNPQRRATPGVPTLAGDIIAYFANPKLIISKIKFLFGMDPSISSQRRSRRIDRSCFILDRKSKFLC